MAKGTNTASQKSVDQTATETVDQNTGEIVETKATDVNPLPAQVDGDGDLVAGEGFRARRAFMPKLFLPHKDWIMQNVLVHGAGTRATLGRIYGQAFEANEKTQSLPDGKPSTTIVLVGAFEAQNYISGELMSVSNAYLPMAYAERIRAVFKAGEQVDGDGKVTGNNIKVVEIDCDIGLEATGKPIPYEWVVTAFLEGKEMDRLKKMRTLRARPTELTRRLTHNPA